VTSGPAPINEALSVLLPGPDEAALLEACLHTGRRAREGWACWRARRGPSPETVCHDRSATRTLLPLLARSATRNSLDLGANVFAYVRAAALREELRATRFRQIAAQALAALEESGTTAYVVRGAALAATVYDSWSLRHCHDLDLLAPGAELAGAIRALSGVGFVAAGSTRGPCAGARLRHTSGLEIAVHTRPFAVAYYDAAVDEFACPGQAIAIDGATARIPSPEATLVHVLGHATYSPSRRNLRWVTDAWHLVARHPDLDWTEITARVGAYRLALPVSILLGHLTALGVGVPPAVLAHVRACAAVADRAAEDVAIGGAHAATHGDIRRLWHATPSWRGRMRVVRWAVAPSPTYLRSTCFPPSAWLYPLCYLYRPARFLAGRFGHGTPRPPAVP
jgi:hypothetical protein